MNAAITITAMIMQRITSDPLRVRIEVEPKRVLHTSPEIFEEDGNRFIRM